MSLLNDAIGLVRSAWAKRAPVSAMTFIVPQGPLTVSRPISFAPDGYYIEDLCFFLAPGQSQDMGALFTQKQINESFGLKEGLLLGQVTYTATGTTPMWEPVAGCVVAPAVQVKDVSNVLINPAKEDGNLLAIYNLLLGLATSGSPWNVYGEAAVPAGGVHTTVLTVSVIVGTTIKIQGLTGWGDTDADYSIKVGGTKKGGGRSSIAVPTLNVDYYSGAIVVVGPAVITVVVEQFSHGPHNIKVNLSGVSIP